jgi:hypothetical protein
MTDPDFYTGEDWVFRGTAVDENGARVSMIGATVSVRFSTSLGRILDLTQADDEVTVSTDPSGTWDYEVVVTPDLQPLFTSPYGRYKIQVRVMTADGRVSIESSRRFRVEVSSFTLFI